MPHPYLFDYQTWEANEQAAQINAQNIEQNKLELQSKELALRAAQRSEAAQLTLASTLQSRQAEFSATMEKDPDKALAQLAMETALAGDVAGSADLLAKSALARQHSMAAVKAHAETVNLEADTYDGVLAGVTDEASARAAAAELASKYPEDGEYINELLLKGYDPEKIATARRGLIDQKRQAEIDLLRARESYNKQKTEESRVNTETVLPSRVKANEALATKRTKAGGVTTQGAKDTKTRIRNIIASEWDVDPKENKVALDLLADDVAIRANDILESNPTLTRLEAADRAYTELQREGAFSEFAGREGTPTNPLPLPLKDGKIDTEALDTKTSYTVTLKDGSTKVVSWNGKMFGTPRRRRISDISVEEETPEEEAALGEEEE